MQVEIFRFTGPVEAGADGTKGANEWRIDSSFLSSPSIEMIDPMLIAFLFNHDDFSAQSEDFNHIWLYPCIWLCPSTI